MRIARLCSNGVGTHLPRLLKNKHHVTVDGERIAAMGHSVGGTIALWLASQDDSPKAIAAFYPSLYLSNTETTAHKLYPGFSAMPVTAI